MKIFSDILFTIYMIKVFDKNKGWYIRTFPNNLKEDNLG